jgi:hypothetical protein
MRKENVGHLMNSPELVSALLRGAMLLGAPHTSSALQELHGLCQTDRRENLRFFSVFACETNLQAASVIKEIRAKLSKR